MKFISVNTVLKRIAIVTFLFCLGCVCEAQAKFFTKCDAKDPFYFNQKVIIDSANLTEIADHTAEFLKKVHTSKYTSVSIGSVFKDTDITLKDVEDTVDFIARMGRLHPEWLRGTWFYTQYFDFYRWHTDHACFHKEGPFPLGWLRPPHAVRITNYRTLSISASDHKTKQYYYPLYEVPSDEKKHVPSYIASHRGEFLRFMFTLPQILAGALEGNPKTHVIAWVTEDGYRECAMQGSGLLAFKDGTTCMVQITGHNNKDKKDRYFFVQRAKPRPKAGKHPVKVDPIPGVSFAGDIDALGFGKVFVFIGRNSQTLEKEMRVGVLVDTGGAFKDNLCKLDLFLGHFDNVLQFREAQTKFPHSAQVYMIIKKRDLFGIGKDKR